MPREILKRPLARKDLNGIWHYTYEHWGEAQADRYLRKLSEAIHQLSEEPQGGKDQARIRADYYSIHVGRHIVFYTFNDQMVGVERVLHDQMDFGRHL